MKEVSVSILSNNNKYDNIRKLNNSNCDYIHLDIMDGNFVPNRFINLFSIKRVLKTIKKEVDVHLMVNNPKKYIDKLSLFNISYITIHYEIKDFEKYIDYIKEKGIKVGLSIKPKTNVKEIFPLLDKLDLVLVMSVEPGKSGQKFIKETKEKIEDLRKEINRRGLNTKISVDGGICYDVKDMIKDVDILVSASYVLKDLDNINKLKSI